MNTIRSFLTNKNNYKLYFFQGVIAGSLISCGLTFFLTKGYIEKNYILIPNILDILDNKNMLDIIKNNMKKR